MKTLAAVTLLATGLAFSQTFEVASVKPAHPLAGTARFSMSGGPGTGDPGRISFTNIMLKRVLLSAYDIKPWQISGPDWLDYLRFDITARIPEGATRAQFQVMLRNLLVDRFRMAVHRETREVSIYALVVAKNGPKLKLAANDSETAAPTPDEQLAIMKREEGSDGFPALSLGASGLVIETRNGRGRVTARRTVLSKFADLLAGQLGRPVIDRTGLSGTYDFVLYFAPEGMSANTTDPGIFGALHEQLGLRLEARKGPVEMIVVDHAEPVPTEN
jgi:uncharacterized protein (TIGR03435 family)